jgi:hypothetical protein
VPDAPGRGLTGITFYAAQGIREDSWLNDDTISEDFAAFREGYAYARNMTHAIPGLSKISAEEAYYVWWGINHGIELSAPARTPSDANAPSDPS